MNRRAARQCEVHVGFCTGDLELWVDVAMHLLSGSSLAGSD